MASESLIKNGEFTKSDASIVARLEALGSEVPEQLESLTTMDITKRLLELSSNFGIVAGDAVVTEPAQVEVLGDQFTVAFRLVADDDRHSEYSILLIDGDEEAIWFQTSGARVLDGVGEEITDQAHIAQAVDVLDQMDREYTATELDKVDGRYVSGLIGQTLDTRITEATERLSRDREVYGNYINGPVHPVKITVTIQLGSESQSISYRGVTLAAAIETAARESRAIERRSSSQTADLVGIEMDLGRDVKVSVPLEDVEHLFNVFRRKR